MTDDARQGAASPPTPPSPTPSSVKRLPELTRAAMWWTALVIGVLTAGAVTVLWWPATAGLTGADLVKARLDALKIGLSIGVGSGGVVALYLAWRRQHSTEADLDNRERALAQQYEVLAHQQADAAANRAHQERVADDARSDATARRITDLYLKAAELLGSEKAPVRLSGLYALERLAQDNETQRQTIVNVLCAYLRMPYEPPVEAEPDDRGGINDVDNYRERTQEREVRLTAQRLLKDHLNPRRSSSYWGELDLDLTGAQLIDFTLTGARAGTSTFRKATFTGTASFDHATFTGATLFTKATFTRNARFEGTTFTGGAWFDEATFSLNGWFNKTTFRRGVMFDRATFHGDARFVRATFAGKAVFYKTAFNTYTRFEEATFTGPAQFDQAVFNRFVKFDKVTFTDKAWFTKAAFTSDASFDLATFADDVLYDGATFGSGAWFREARFTGAPQFNAVTFNGKSSFDKATVDGTQFHPTALLPHKNDDPTN
ncbi:pentapeptide repeat-containing protein [Amycolatopsis japonica]|nr:pentapeptide repeat-containing protein [Amycolatopsis japonica]